MERPQTFQLLKPACVELIQVITSRPQRPGANKEIVQSLTKLLQALQLVTARPESLDAKLAEFVFVPISHVLRSSKNVPVHALELSLECISVLLRTGWKGDLSPALAGQLLILFTFLANSSSAENGIPATSEELQAAAFKCMSELLVELSRTPQGRTYLTETANIPNLGKAVLIMLDSVCEVKSNAVRLQALAAVQALVSGIDDLDALASFLPRMVSTLTKLLTPSSIKRAGFRVIESGLQTMSLLLGRILCDRETRNLPPQSTKNAEKNSDARIRTTAWLSATTTQIKIALANMLKLRNHDKKEVRQALLQLCLKVIQECRTSLSECISMVIETLVTLAGRGEDDDTVENRLKTLLYSDEKLSELLRESLNGWVTSLPRLMQSKDDATRRQIIQQISIAVCLLTSEQFDLTKIDVLLAGNLRDGLSTVLGDSKTQGPLVESARLTTIDTSLVLNNAQSITFQTLELRFKGQDDMMHEFRYLLRELSKSSSAATVAQDLVRSMEYGSQETQLASFWLSVNLLKEMRNYNAATDDFLDLGTSDVQDELLDILYDSSLAKLAQTGGETDLHWHFQALALEVLALQASRYKKDFRPELVEALYPVLHLLGTQNKALQDHAMTCLNILAETCGYSSASDLIISNVDYIINAVGLQLNYQDISPQAPQVLLMMMRLCGPSLLPYLDDLVGSMFSALERFHGYPKLVELLFLVLSGMAEEGVKAPQLMITSNKTGQQQPSKPRSMSDVTSAIISLEADALKKDGEHQEAINAFPHRPWKDQTKDPEDTNEAEALHENEEDDQAVSAPDEPPPAPRTFDIILKISDLTQHYLTSSSPSLRASLLALLHTTIPALARHENSYLPLINTLWPVLLPRIEDPEAYVVANALDIIALMCTHAGNFMKGRIENAWGDISAVHRRTRTNTKDKSLGTPILQISQKLDLANVGATPTEVYRPELYVSAPSRMISDSLIHCLCAVARSVAVRETYFDDLLDMLDLELEKEDVRGALEARNADAVWLRLYSKSEQQTVGKGDGLNRSAEPCISIGRLPGGLRGWNFVKVV